MNINLFFEILPQLILACKNTVTIAFFSTMIGLVGGTLVALGLRSAIAPLKYFLHAYITIIRGTPMVVQIVFWYYGFQLPIDPLIIAIIAIGCNSCAYVSQVMQSGIRAVDKGQLEAAHVMGFTKTQTLRYIILPQAIRVVLPSLGNEFITLIKDSSLAYIIGVQELFKESRNIVSSTYDVITVYVAVTLLYLAMTSALTIIMQHVEKELEKPC